MLISGRKFLQVYLSSVDPTATLLGNSSDTEYFAFQLTADGINLPAPILWSSETQLIVVSSA
jgi:hypothetical protein